MKVANRGKRNRELGLDMSENALLSTVLKHWRTFARGGKLQPVMFVEVSGYPRGWRATYLVIHIIVVCIYIFFEQNCAAR